MIWLGIVIIIVGFVVFVTAVEKVKYDEFDELCWWLASLGIYQWGQGVILSFFWILFGLACLFWWSASQAMFAYILFHVVRALLELVLTSQGHYVGLTEGMIFQSTKMTPLQRMHLYILTQGLIIMIGILILAFLSTK